MKIWNSLFGKLFMTFLISMVPVLELRGAIPIGVAHGLDYRAAARAGLLHDLYLQKWEETDVGRFRRLVIHPQLALENARAFGLSPMEEDIIGKHMWPLTAPLPYYKESYMVSLADKICATLEMAHLYGLLGVRRNLRACRPALLRRAVQ